MALPASLDTVTVSGGYVLPDGTPVKGRLLFTAKRYLTVTGSDVQVAPATVTAELDNAGRYTAQLPATDDPDVPDAGWTYRVVEDFTNAAGRTYDVDVPIAAKATGLDLSTVAPAPPSDGGPTAFVTLSTFLGHTHAGTTVDWSTITSKPDTFPPDPHTHPQSDVTGLSTALAGKSDVGHGHAIGDVTGLSTALAGKAGAILLRRGYVTSGDITPQSTGGAWQRLTGGPTISIPAAVGDYVELNLSAMRDTAATSTFLDVAVFVAGPAQSRYASSGGASPALEGDPALYPAGTFKPSGFHFGFVVAAGDLDSGSVTFGFVVRSSSAAGKLYASTNYPLRWRAMNYGALS